MDSFRKIAVTPSYDRIQRRFRALAVGDESADVGHLVLALLWEESLGGKCLTDFGMTVGRVAEGCFGTVAADAAAQLNGLHDDLPNSSSPSTTPPLTDDTWFTALIDRATRIARSSGPGAEISTVHLVQAMVEIDGPARSQLEAAGIPCIDVLNQLHTIHTPESTGLAVDFQLRFDDTGSTIETTPVTGHSTSSPRCAQSDESRGVDAAIDANLNRSREGLRVLEDYTRFVRHDAALSQVLKDLRHNLVSAEHLLTDISATLLAARDTEADAGTGLSTQGERCRASIKEMVRANCRRVEESLRSLEEFGKLRSPQFAERIKQLRYRMYGVEQQMIVSSDFRAVRLQRLQTARLYLLVTEQLCRLPWQDVVLRALEGGVDVVQLREKDLPDDELVSRSQWLAAQCEAAGALFVLNDRFDLVEETGAHAVHLGQEDLVAGQAAAQQSDVLLGISTHNLEQVRSATSIGADYLGTGPVFPSQTKSFQEFLGIEFVREANAFTDRPCFAIGGINHSNLQQVLDAGATRVAVSSAVIGSDDPQHAATELREIIERQSDSTSG